MRHKIIGCPPGTRLLRVIRHADHWQLWTATRDYKFGTYLRLYHSGLIMSVTEREGEGPEEFMVRPADKWINEDD